MRKLEKPRNERLREKNALLGYSMRVSLEGEIWLPVKGYEGKYEVSNKGRVYSISYRRILAIQKKYRTGNILTAIHVGLKKDGKRIMHRVHRLVAYAFIENHENKPEVDHIDNNPANNNIENLQWATRREQMQWSYEGGRDRKFGEKANCAKLTNNQAIEIRKRYKNGDRFTDLCKEFNISESSMCLLIKNKSYLNV
jgi:hypothetical protein